ncbi:hypothetical protein E5083_06950 [Streptomyces bauhiniae]|uniref:Uncharacterized protein n=1 Tax=Streptomyces bauhiniae TaxID=2340725 RepID=A0A4Z1D8Z6_9ACTN|nr:hypothetical protein E5083_06950 [Streptomyces bauhiniae]
MIGDLTAPDTLTAAVRDIDAVIFVHGSDDDSRPESTDAVRDKANLRLDEEPARVRDDLAHVRIP